MKLTPTQELWLEFVGEGGRILLDDSHVSISTRNYMYRGSGSFRRSVYWHSQRHPTAATIRKLIEAGLIRRASKLSHWYQVTGRQDKLWYNR